MAESFPWRDVMAFGLGRLRLSPCEFWATTLRELSAAAEGLNGPRTTPMQRAELAELMARHPDQRTKRWTLKAMTSRSP